MLALTACSQSLRPSLVNARSRQGDVSHREAAQDNAATSHD